MSAQMLARWIQSQEIQESKTKNASVFYRNLEEVLDRRRAEHNFLMLRSKTDAVDFSSNDFLSLGSTGLIRMAFFDELARHSGFELGSTGSRLLDGNNDYIELVEKELADFHGAEACIIVNSGYEANGSIFSAIPQRGDAIIFDELIHASVHDGMKHCLATCRVSFRHNDVRSFRETLISVRDSQPLIAQGDRAALISIESVYSMDGDVAPVKEYVAVAKEIFPHGNAQFIIDEAHSTGVIGPNGSGLICALGLENEMAIRLHTFGKALASHGAAILCSNSVRDMLINFARSIIYTTAPSFPMLAAIRAGYTLMKNGVTQPVRHPLAHFIPIYNDHKSIRFANLLTAQAQDTVQQRVKQFFRSVSANSVWVVANKAGVMSIPLMEDWESRPFVTQIVPIWTRPGYDKFLCFHLQLSKNCAWPICYPVVPKDTERVRLVFHASNTEAQVDELASVICAWAREMMDIEKSDAHGTKIPTAAREVYQSSATVPQTNEQGTFFNEKETAMTVVNPIIV